MKRYLTVDGGTTNTRVYLVCDRKVTDFVKINIGAQKSISGGDELKAALKNAIGEILSRNSLVPDDIECIPTSGMITSEFGLYNLPHITVPAGIKELKNATKTVSIPEICDIPFVFIAGVKQVSDDLADTDIMRGEETELIGLCEKPMTNTVYILPGSHSKLIKTDGQGRIASFKTMLTGEMIAALSQNTILKDAVDLSIDTTDNEFLVKGFDYAVNHGINEALFKTRVLKNIFGADPVRVYSFYLGAVLSDEICAAKKMNPENIVVGGKAQLRNAMITLISKNCECRITDVGDSADFASALGAVSVVEAF